MRSMASALRYCRQYDSLLADSENTAQFCEQMNDLFDALNRKTVNAGEIPDNNDFKVHDTKVHCYQY